MRFIKQTIKINDCSFQQVLRQKLGWFLSQHQKMLFLRSFILKSTERAQILLKSGTRDFQNSPPFEGSACFYVTLSGSLKRFQYFNFETGFQENENLFQDCRFLVESIKIENPLFPYKTAISGANVKTNRIVITKYTYNKEGSFATNYFIFLKILFQFKNLL